MIWVGRVLVEECGGSEVLQKEAPVCPAEALTMSHFSLVSPRSHGHNAPLNSPAGRPRDAATTCFFNIQQKLKYLCGFAHTHTLMSVRHHARRHITRYTHACALRHNCLASCTLLHTHTSTQTLHAFARTHHQK